MRTLDPLGMGRERNRRDGQRYGFDQYQEHEREPPEQKGTSQAMRTDAEIIARMKEIEPRDQLGFERSELLIRLPLEAAKPFLKPDAAEETWPQARRDRESLVSEMLSYMPFAWEKANGKRGISASRSMSHFAAWTWLAGDDLGDLTGYEHYGKDNLVRICRHYGWDSSQWDDGIRANE